MATNNLLVNNEKKVLYDIQRRVERSGHNLSQSRKFPAKVGYIYPFFCRKTLPSDSFKISTNILIKQLQPLLVPQMVSFTVNTAFYWVDYQLAFPQFEYFLINQRGQQNIELPYISDSSETPVLYRVGDSQLSNNLRTYLDFSRNEIREKVDALPFWSYKTIIRDYYLNIDRLSEGEYNKWYPADPNVWKLKAGYNGNFGDPTNSVTFDELNVHNVRGDYFVNSYPSPLRGDTPVLESVADTVGFDELVLKLNNSFDLSDTIGKQLDLTSGYSSNSPRDVIALDSNTSNYTVKLGAQIDSSHPQAGNITFKTSDNSGNYFHLVNENFNTLNRVLKQQNTYSVSSLQDLNVRFSITTRQLRLLESLTRKREIDILMKPRLKNYLQTYFDVKNYQNDSLYQPVFIGSTTQQVLINDINQTTATSDSPLGRQGATAMSLGSGYVGEYFCRNYGCLMGLMYILPDYDYEPAIPREWSERTPDDFYNPEFSHLSMQGILNKELYNSGDDAWNNQVLGYGGIYDNYRTSQNLVTGDLLNTSMEDVRQFAQVRRFDDSNMPEITTSFLNSASAFDSSVFSVPSLPPFIAQCVTRVEAVRPIPEIATPRDM